MIGSLVGALRRARRMLSRSEWTAVLLGLPRSEGTALRPGLLIVQVDGLSRRRLSSAVENGAMPFVAHLLADEGYQLHPLYSGVPSSTPAVQGELFYGVPQAVPAFGFATHEDGRLVRMWQPDAATAVERRMADQRSLLAGGSSYCNIYTGGATQTRFCMASLGWADAVHVRHPLALPALAFLYAPEALRAAFLVAWEMILAPGGLIAGLARGQDARLRRVRPPPGSVVAARPPRSLRCRRRRPPARTRRPPVPPPRLRGLGALRSRTGGHRPLYRTTRSARQRRRGRGVPASRCRTPVGDRAGTGRPRLRPPAARGG